ncbi:unnamed protein product [Protopolystoma xenopodis]|uniref:Uncharacterized protein n=1 Tax=Protopolystoma xenopodis TaxID=117903 RepID=A0A448WJ12_9PLAT|nr:unnamed protein product [Protopolystoma xenopodis]
MFLERIPRTTASSVDKYPQMSSAYFYLTWCLCSSGKDNLPNGIERVDKVEFDAAQLNVLCRRKLGGPERFHRDHLMMLRCLFLVSSLVPSLPSGHPMVAT